MSKIVKTGAESYTFFFQQPLNKNDRYDFLRTGTSLMAFQRISMEKLLWVREWNKRSSGWT